MMKRTIHEGSVSYSQTLPDPRWGEGKHYKKPTREQEGRRNRYMLTLFIRRCDAGIKKPDSNQNQAKWILASAYGKSVSE